MKDINFNTNITIKCNISSGNGLMGVYGSSSKDESWKGTSYKTSTTYPSSTRLAIEVYNVSGYEIESVGGLISLTNLEGPYNLSGGRGKYWIFTMIGYSPQLTVTYKAVTPKYTVSTAVSPVGGGTVTGGGTYTKGTVINLIAYYNEGYVFDHWNIGGTLYYNQVQPYQVNSNVTATAYFKYNKATVSIEVRPSGAGYTTGQGTYNKGTTITLLAYTNEGYVFDYWLIQGTKYYDPSKTIQVNENLSIIAQYKEKTSLLTLEDVPNNVGKLIQWNSDLSEPIYYGREHSWRVGTHVRAYAQNQREDPSLPSFYKFDHWFDGSRPEHFSPTINRTIGELGEILTAHYKPKRVWLLKVIIDADPQSDTTYNIVPLHSEEMTSLGNDKYRIYEGSDLSQIKVTINNSYNYIFDKMTFNDEVISTDPIKNHFYLPDITDNEDHTATLKIYVKRREIIRRSVYVAVLPTDAPSSIFITRTYRLVGGGWATETYEATANNPISFLAQDGDYLRLLAVGRIAEGVDWSFKYWTGDLPDIRYKKEPEIDQIYVNKNMSFYGNFGPAITFTVSKTPEEGGTVYVYPPAEHIPGTNAYKIVMGEELMLTATPNPGFTFSHWLLDGQIGPSDPTYTIASMSGQDYKDFKAVFTSSDYHTLTVVAVPIHMGTTSGSGSYRTGSLVTISAQPRSSQYEFVKWFEDGSTLPTRSVIVTEDLTYTAMFREKGSEPIEIDIIGWYFINRRKRKKKIIIK